MKAKSGKAPSPVAPADPTIADDADVADPGEVAETKAKQIEEQKGKYGKSPVQPHKPPEDEDGEETKTAWIEIELLDEEDNPVPGEAYEIELPDGSVASGSLDQNGFARVEGIEPGDCKVTFPNLDKDAWEPA